MNNRESVKYTELFLKATGEIPFGWQVKLALEGFPELISIPTGLGKTYGIVIAWIFRRIFHESDEVKNSTPNRLILVSPMRTLVEQQLKIVKSVLGKLGISDIPIFVLEGGMTRQDAKWREELTGDSIIIATIDMAISRALNRGYGSTRRSWPMELGVISNGSLWVFDEVQLMGPSFPTSRQLDAFRKIFKTLKPSATVWMSATPNLSAFETYDNPSIGSVLRLDSNDLENQEVKKRVDAKKLIKQIKCDEKDDRSDLIVKTILKSHEEGTLSIALLNTVEAAVEVYNRLKIALCKLDNDSVPQCFLMHSRFRLADRKKLNEQALSGNSDGPGTIIVSTQVIEAGVDISAKLMISEVSSPSSVVQRIGRCNRGGEYDVAEFFWISPKDTWPYDEKQINRSREILESLEANTLTSLQIHDQFSEDFSTTQTFQVIRKRDFLQLFSTSPDLSGSDVDISRYVREIDDIDVFIAWRDFEGNIPDETKIFGDELCRISIRAIKKWFGKDKQYWVKSANGKVNKWQRFEGSSQIKPGMIVVTSSVEGGYDPQLGFSPGSKSFVDPIIIQSNSAVETEDDSVDANQSSYIGKVVYLEQHLRDVEDEVNELIHKLNIGVPEMDLSEAVILSAKFHDLGKVHDVFQRSMTDSVPEDKRYLIDRSNYLAKSVSDHFKRYERQYFRHELVSLIILRENADLLLPGIDDLTRKLIMYLVASHHGKVRTTIRGFPEENDSASLEETRVVLGVKEDDITSQFRVLNVTIPETKMNFGFIGLAHDESWTVTVNELLEKFGPFQLAFLEAILQIADWRASDKEANSNV